MQYKVLKNVGKHAAGATVTDADFTPGRPAELVRQGVLEPTDGNHAVPMDGQDLDGYKRRCAALEADNLQLRTTPGGPQQLARINELEGILDQVQADFNALQDMNTTLTEGAVSRGDHETLRAQHQQLEHLHKTTVDELEAVRAELATLKGDGDADGSAVALDASPSGPGVAPNAEAVPKTEPATEPDETAKPKAAAK